MPVLKARLDKARVFLIPLEEGMGIKNSESDLSKAIGSRMLLQLLPEMDLNEILREYYPPTPIDVFMSFANGEHEDFSTKFTGVLVHDGIQTLLSQPGDARDKDSQFYRMLADLCDLSLNSRGAFLISCFTATVTVPMKNFLASTGRPRIYLEVASLKPPTTKQNSHPVFEEDVLSSLLVEDCGGHGRALLALKKIDRHAWRHCSGAQCERYYGEDKDRC